MWLNPPAMQKDHSNSFFVFTKKEKRGIIAVLLIIFLLFISAEYLYPLLVRDKPVAAGEIDSAAFLLRQSPGDSTPGYADHYDAYDQRETFDKKHEAQTNFSGQMFYFDPNTLDEAGWLRLGVKEKTAATILKYISKGGKFREPEDLNKIWGLSDEQKQRLIPYVRIIASPSFSQTYTHYEKKVYEKKTIAAVDINDGDTTAFIGLPGIGPGYSRRIVNFRNKLGGFYKVEQVAETFGLPDSVFQKIKPFLRISGEVKKININTASVEELKAHPYIRWQLANIITEYKKQHGNFHSADDLRKIMVMDAATMEKILPYISF